MCIHAVRSMGVSERVCDVVCPYNFFQESMARIIRIFPRKTKATPMDADVRINVPPSFFDEADEIHISVTFTWDLPIAERLYNEWKHVAPTKIGGVALGMRGEEFTPGMYIKHGYTITSRGCNNQCWFCSVWKRDGTIRELKIKDGYNVLDDNLLQCAEQHIDGVFDMLKKQKQQIEFTGGIEARLVTESIAKKMKEIKLKQLFCAYDTPDDLPYLITAGQIFKEMGVAVGHTLRAYVLIGYPKDTMDKALLRIEETIRAGFMPLAMLWRDKDGLFDPEWKRFQRQWANPIITAVNMKKII